MPGGAEFAGRVLAKIPKLGLKGIESAEDYAADLLKSRDIRVRKETFLALLQYYHGKPVQPVQAKLDAPAGINVYIHRVGAKS